MTLLQTIRDIVYPKQRTSICIRKAINGEYYWLAKAANGEELCSSTETYKTKQMCLKGLASSRKTLAVNNVIDEL